MSVYPQIRQEREMVIRVLPASKGGIYSNAGSSHFLVNYLEHEAREEKREDAAIFFDQSRGDITAVEVQETIDANVKGLQKEKPWFHSLVISPSQGELQHLNNDSETLTKYTRQVMENYAGNFADKRQRLLKSDDLVWFATVHRNRHYSGFDDAVQTGQAQPRQQKEGEQTHVHIIVSARDKTMSRSLHPDAGNQRFNYGEWLQKNQHDFEQSFGYKHITTEIQHQQRLDKQVDRLNRAGLSLDPEKITIIGQSHHYSPVFWKGMNQVERGVKQGTVFTQNQAYERLNATIESKNDNWRLADRRAVETYVPSRNVPPVHEPGQAKNTTETAVPLAISIPGSNQGTPVPKESAATMNRNNRQEQSQPPVMKNSRADLSPLLSALTFESVPETGEQARTQTDDYRRKIKRRR